MIEVACVLDLHGEVLHWHLPPDRTGGSIPDSSDLWQIIWENRDKIFAVAHTHPGRGVPWPSSTDMSTFKAVEAALGRPLTWIILSQDEYTFVVRRNLPDHDIIGGVQLPAMSEPVALRWINQIRELSKY